MGLIKTIAEIRSLLPRISTLSDKANLPNMDRAAWKYIIPIIGQALYDELLAAYTPVPNTLSVQQQTLLKHIQLPLAAGALYDELPFMHTFITDNGIRTPETSSGRASQKWEYNYLKNGLYKSIEEGQEILLDHLYRSKADFPAWTASTSYKRIHSLVINNAREFDRLYKLKTPVRTFWSMESILVDVEENYLVGRLGRDLMGWIKEQQQIEVIENGARVNVKEFILKAAALFTIKAACAQRKVVFDHFGFTILSDDDSGNPEVRSMTDKELMSVYHKAEEANRDGQNYLAKAAYYLKGIANGEFDDAEFGAEFNIAFERSPLYVPPGVVKEAMTNGNERRRGVFRLGS